MRDTVRAARRATRDRTARRGLAEAVKGARWALRERRVVPTGVEVDLRRLESDPTTRRPRNSYNPPREEHPVSRNVAEYMQELVNRP